MGSRPTINIKVEPLLVKTQVASQVAEPSGPKGTHAGADRPATVGSHTGQSAPRGFEALVIRVTFHSSAVRPTCCSCLCRMSTVPVDDAVKVFKESLLAVQQAKNQIFTCLHSIDAHNTRMMLELDKLRVSPAWSVGTAPSPLAAVARVSRPLDPVKFDDSVEASRSRLESMCRMEKQLNTKCDGPAGALFSFMPPPST